MKRGLILGKFMPIHKGHQYLIEQAMQHCGQLSILVCSLRSEPIDGVQRYRWVKELYPMARVIHVTDENPSYPHEHPNFWQIWTDTVRRAHPEAIDLVFTSEDYGEQLASCLGARHLCIDRDRSTVPVSATLIRGQPLKYWDFIPKNVQPYFVKKVVVYGPESVGKSTMAAQLAAHFNTIWVPEFARGYLNVRDRLDGRFSRGMICEYEDIEQIAVGQMASEEAFLPQANKLLFFDTDLLTTYNYSRYYFNKFPNWMPAMLAQPRYDLHLLLNTDVPWVADAQRDRPLHREELYALFKNTLLDYGKAFVEISGALYQERIGKAKEVLEEMLK